MAPAAAGNKDRPAVADKSLRALFLNSFGLKPDVDRFLRVVRLWQSTAPDLRCDCPILGVVFLVKPHPAKRPTLSHFVCNYGSRAAKYLLQFRKPLLGASQGRSSVSKLSALLVVFLLPASMWMFGEGPRNQVKADLSSIPVSLSLDQAFAKGEVNQALSVTVSLKNARGATVTALQDQKVQLHYGGQLVEGVIPAGAQSATFRVTPRSSGVAKIDVAGGHLAAASGMVLAVDRGHSGIHPISELPPPPPPPPSPSPTPSTSHKLAKTAIGFPHVALPAPTPAPASTPAPVSSQLKVFVTPENIEPDPESGQWKTQVAVALMGPNDELVPSDRDLQLQLVAQQGQLNPSQVTIKKDEASTFGTPVSLTSSSPGTDVISVFSTLPRVQQSVTYETPQPSQLRLEATPVSVINDGRSPIRIVILLQDANNNPIRGATATEVTLTSSRGNLAPLVVTIPAGEYSAEAALTSQQNGVANVTAVASNLQRAQISAAFLFPWMLVSMGALGGVLGGTLHNPKNAFSAQWWKVVVLGVICGVVLSVAALLGAVGSLPKLGLPVQISQIPSANELGALLLGFVGGFYGKKLWSKGDSAKPDQTAAQAAGKTG